MIPRNTIIIAQAPLARRILLLFGWVGIVIFCELMALQYGVLSIKGVVAAVLGVVMGIVLILGGRRFAARIEVDDKELTVWRGGRVKERYDLSDLERISRLVGVEVEQVIFSGGRTVEVPDNWTGARELTHHLAILLDAAREIDPRKAAYGFVPGPSEQTEAADSERGADNAVDANGLLEPADAVYVPRLRKLVLPTDYLTFPEHCFRCHRPAHEALFLDGSRLLPNKGEIGLPLCRSCRSRIMTVGLALRLAALLWPFAVITFFALTELYWRESMSRTGWFCLMACVALVPSAVVAPPLILLIDYRITRVRLSRMSRGRREVRLAFLDEDAADDVRQKTEDTRRMAIAEARGANLRLPGLPVE